MRDSTGRELCKLHAKGLDVQVEREWGGSGGHFQVVGTFPISRWKMDSSGSCVAIIGTCDLSHVSARSHDPCAMAAVTIQYIKYCTL